MTRLQALLLGLELSVIVWVCMFIGGRWVVEESDLNVEFEFTSAIR